MKGGAVCVRVLCPGRESGLTGCGVWEAAWLLTSLAHFPTCVGAVSVSP